MTPFIPAMAGALILGGVLGTILGFRRTPEKPPAPARTRLPLVARLAQTSPQTRALLLGGAGAGLIIALLTGWIIAIAAVPAAVVGLPALLSSKGAAAKIDRLEALEDWIRSLAGVLTVGVGLEQGLIATGRSVPEPIAPEVNLLVRRLQARWNTEDALRAFADDLDDPTGDLVAANLILGARRRGRGLASVLEALAASVAADVRARRQIEADRAKPRSTARWVTTITAGVLVFLAMTGQYVAPYRTPIGEAIAGLLLCAYVATLIWMRRMAEGEEIPRFIGTEVKENAA
ncbi:membrane protein [Flexivirga endophytica]|uniref:Membrane protein n=2 Tax=Flexivirga endophytica TaxID=1849103 RepID=A0A916SZP2_9MICO|nr:membrane protein [Flexivirga endophytica]GHB59401.1 membrane protein [Flexivirga endophytica]